MVYIALILLGLCLGSFVNALTWRMREQELIILKKKQTKDDKDLLERLSVFKGHSMCPYCKHSLSPLDLIPVLSWLLLGGKCRYCNKPISVQYPIVEMTTALIFVASYVWWPVSVAGIQIAVFTLWLIAVTGLMALTVYDIKWMLLPNKIIYPLTLVVLVMTALLIIISPSPSKAIFNTGIATIIGGGIFYVLYQVSSGKWIGGGDVRLGAVLGLIMATPGRSILLIFLASLTGTLVSLPLLVSNKLKRNSIIPFGPFLILAAVIVQLFGHFILAWYQNSFFPNGV